MSAGGALLGAIDRHMPTPIVVVARSGLHRPLRQVYRGVPRTQPATMYIGRIYTLALGTVMVASVAVLLATVMGWIAPSVPMVVLSIAASVGLAGAVVFAGWSLPQLRAEMHRREVARTLPGAVDHLQVLASGAESPRAMFTRLVDVDVHGGTGAEFRRVLTIATLSGRLDEGIMTVARLTAAQESLRPFLVNLRAHLAQGPEALRGFLALEARLLRHQQAAHRRQTMGMLELIAELVMVLLVVPALVVVIVTMLGPIVPVSSQVVPTPVGGRPLGELIVYLAGGFVLAVGGVAGQMVATLRPQEHVTSVKRPEGAMATVAAAGSNPAAMSVVAAVPTLLVTAGLGVLDGRLGLALVVGFTIWATTVGMVGWRQAREDDAKDEHLRELVHAVAGYVELGIPFGDAVERIAQETDLGPLRQDVAHLAFALRLRDRHPDHEGPTQEVALDRFAHRVGTPLAARTVGVIASALAAGAHPRLIFERLQTQVAELYRTKQSMRAEMQVYAAVGWTTALLVVGISVAATTQLFDQLSMVSAMGGQSIAGAGYRVMLTTVATAIAAGWFAGMAIRDRYAGLLHAGVLSMITVTVGWLVGML